MFDNIYTQVKDVVTPTLSNRNEMWEKVTSPRFIPKVVIGVLFDVSYCLFAETTGAYEAPQVAFEQGNACALHGEVSSPSVLRGRRVETSHESFPAVPR